MIERLVRCRSLLSDRKWELSWEITGTFLDLCRWSAVFNNFILKLVYYYQAWTIFLPKKESGLPSRNINPQSLLSSSCLGLMITLLWIRWPKFKGEGRLLNFSGEFLCIIPPFLLFLSRWIQFKLSKFKWIMFQNTADRVILLFILRDEREVRVMFEEWVAMMERSLLCIELTMLIILKMRLIFLCQLI